MVLRLRMFHIAAIDAHGDRTMVTVHRVPSAKLLGDGLRAQRSGLCR